MFMKEYKGYSGQVAMDDALKVFYGNVIGINDVITFQGSTFEELTQAFHDSVDDYLAFCASRKEKPDKPYSGRLVLRMPPEQHRRIALAAVQANMSMNEWIVGNLDKALGQSGGSTASRPQGVPQSRSTTSGGRPMRRNIIREDIKL